MRELRPLRQIHRSPLFGRTPLVLLLPLLLFVVTHHPMQAQNNWSIVPALPNGFLSPVYAEDMLVVNGFAGGFHIARADGKEWRTIRVPLAWLSVFGNGILLYRPIDTHVTADGNYRLTTDYGESFTAIPPPPIDPVRFHYVDGVLWGNGFDTLVTPRVRRLLRYDPENGSGDDAWLRIAEIPTSIIARGTGPDGRFYGTSVEEDSLVLSRLDTATGNWDPIGGTRLLATDVGFISRLYFAPDDEPDWTIRVTTPSGSIYRFDRDGGDPTLSLLEVVEHGSRTAPMADGTIFGPSPNAGQLRRVAPDGVATDIDLGFLATRPFAGSQWEPKSDGLDQLYIATGRSTNLYRVDAITGTEQVTTARIFYPLDSMTVRTIDTAENGDLVLGMGSYAAILPKGAEQVRGLALPISENDPVPLPIVFDTNRIRYYGPQGYLSNDGGASWKETGNSGPPRADRDGGGRLYGVTNWANRSDDSGATWTELVGPVGPTMIVAEGQHVWSSTFEGLYYSIDRGENWRMIPERPREIRSGIIRTDGTFVGRVQQDADRDEPYTTIIGPTDTVSRSISFPCPGSDFVDLPFVHDGKGQVFAPLPCGLFRLSATSDSWEQITAMPEGVTPLSLMVTADGRAWLGTTGGLYVRDDVTSANDGSDWRRVDALDLTDADR